MNSKSAKPETCQVAIFNEPNQTLEIRHEAIPVIANDELLVRVNACTICGSDLHTITGKRKEDTPRFWGMKLLEMSKQLVPHRDLILRAPKLKRRSTYLVDLY